MKKLVIIITLFIIQGYEISGQSISGIVVDEKDKLPVAYVNIGVAGKNIGTVSDVAGRYELQIDEKNDDDTLLFTCIGYMPYSIKISALRNETGKNIVLEKNYYQLDEVLINPKIFEQKTLGVITRSRKLSVIPQKPLLGKEYGILMKVKKSAVIKKVNINVLRCSYDTVFYRINIYKVLGELRFENVLRDPVYINLSKYQVKDKISIDLQSYNIVVDGDFLVSLEHVKDLGPGNIEFCGSFTEKTYFKETSHGQWQKNRFGGISISVDADVEK